MKSPQSWTDEMISLTQQMFSKQPYWIAYNTRTHEVCGRGIYFFPGEQEARAFAENNVSDMINHRVVYVCTVKDVIRELSYGNTTGENKIDHSLKAKCMNEDNLNDLKERLRSMGFDEKLCADLEHHTGQGFAEFVLKMQSQFGRAKLESTLHFSQSGNVGNYVFNYHDAKLKDDTGSYTQRFYVDQDYNISPREAFNLLEGRAVYKEITKAGEKHPTWLQLDFKNSDEGGNYKVKQFGRVHGFHLEASLAKFPITEMEGGQRERILISLQKGNQQPVTVKMGGAEQRLFIQANPEERSLTMFDYGAVWPLSDKQKEELMFPEARKKLNGKEVIIEGEQQGKQMKQHEKAAKQKNECHVLPGSRARKNKRLRLH